MTVGCALILLALAPAPGAGQAAAPPIERDYAGAKSVEAPAGVEVPGSKTEVESAVQKRPERIEPSVEVEPDTAVDQTPEVLVDDVAPEPPRPPEPVPRILTTMDGWYPGEEARHVNASRTFSFVPGLQVRTRVGAVSEFRIDDDGNLYDEGAFVGGRVRWRPVFGFGRRQNVRLIGMIDFANGRWAPRDTGDPIIDEIIDGDDLIDGGHPPQRWDVRYADPRELYVEWTTQYGQLRVGQMSFSWGQGLLANDGNNMDRFGDLKFGNDGDGSIQERILFATKPLALTGGPGKDVIFALGADLIYRDPAANLLQGDLAGQGFLVVRYEPEDKPGNWIGAYGVYRRQKNADDDDIYENDDLLEVGVADFAGQGFKYVRPKLALIGAFEAVAIAGRTTFAAGEFEELQVLQGGAALRGYLGDPKVWLAGFDAGWASGDANPDDQEVNNFEAAPGYTAGLVMFQYYQGWQSARSQVLAEDPVLSGVPRNGTQFIPTEGRVTNAVYVQPKARYGLWDKFEVWGGPLFASSAVPVVDPFTTRLAGGAPTNSLGGSTHDKRYLGTELDLGIRGRYAFKNFWLQAGIQAGVYFPGPALADASGDTDSPIWGTWFRAEIRY